jgi:(E)-4-hydroxy-3-methylbut-2-enyl-diphosphate synthase
MTSSLLRYCPDLYNYQRRETRPVQVGKVQIGGGAPVVVQSMLTSDTRDAEACVKEALGLAEAGCQIVRVTAQTRVIAENLQHIRDGLRKAGCDVPLVADIHFKPDAAMEAVKWVEKVRVNPGNYADKKKFAVKEYTDDEYAAEVAYMEEQFVPLVKDCIRLGRAMRIGTNHGSLSDRIMNRHGDTPLGMVESALEFARIARAQGYHNFLFSMKASNPKVMIEAYRLLVAHLNKLGSDWNYPIHLGVTEAGDGEDGRIKSAIGIGSLLADGIGDTVRVSLTEDAIFEIPVAQQLVKPYNEGLPAHFERIENAPRSATIPSTMCAANRRCSLSTASKPAAMKRFRSSPHARSGTPWPTRSTSSATTSRRSSSKTAASSKSTRDDAAAVASINASDEAKLVTIKDGLKLPVIAAYRLLAAKIDKKHPILLKDTLQSSGSDDFTENLLVAATNIGSLLCDGIGDAVIVNGEDAPGQALRISYNILQAAGVRIFKTDYVACPSCGRTLFNLQTTTQKIRAATGHLKGVRIAVMGCIVNGPGEMADADFGYVGGAPDKINLYVGKTAVKFNIPEGEAVERLIDLIKEHDRWFDAPLAA